MSEEYSEKRIRRKYEVVKPAEPEITETTVKPKNKLLELWEQRPIITGGETPRMLEEKRKELEIFYTKLGELTRSYSEDKRYHGD